LFGMNPCQVEVYVIHSVILLCSEMELSCGAGRGILTENLEFKTDTSAPYILINRATYGVLSDTSKCVDVTMELQSLVTGRMLRVCQDVNLDKIFSKDPALGLRKQLHFKYTTQGFRGNLRVRERDNLMVAGIQLGYPPVPPRDEYQDFQM
jgi:hypothetical protein